MDIKISDNARQAATKCNKGFSCLKKGKGEFCEVDYCINDRVLFVKALQDKSCPYKQPFGNEFICGCPVRQELYNKYRI